MSRNLFSILTLICFFFNTACTPQATAVPTQAPTDTSVPAETPNPTATLAPTDTFAPNPTAEPTEKTYATTEFEGTFSEKYYPDQFADSFVFKDKESGIEVPISIGLTSDLPVTAVHFTELGKEIMGEYWLLSNYYRYTEIMGNQVTMDAFVQKVQNGEVLVDVDYFDELTGEPKKGHLDPREGVSITLTGNNQMPLDMLPSRDTYEAHFYFTLNKMGQMILVSELDLSMLRDMYEGEIEYLKSNPGYLYSFRFFNSFEASMQYWGILTHDHFVKGGEENINGPKAVEFDNMAKEKYLPHIAKLDPKP